MYLRESPWIAEKKKKIAYEDKMFVLTLIIY